MTREAAVSLHAILQLLPGIVILSWRVAHPFAFFLLTVPQGWMIPLQYVNAEELLLPFPGLAFPGGRPFRS